MKLTIMFWHDHQLIHFEVMYVPAMDKADHDGLWDVDNNRAVVSRKFYNDFFAAPSLTARRKMLETLPKISNYQLT